GRRRGGRWRRIGSARKPSIRFGGRQAAGFDGYLTVEGANDSKAVQGLSNGIGSLRMPSVLAPWRNDARGNPVLIDLHVLTRHAPDSSLDPSEAASAAQSFGLDGVAFVDVDSIAGREEIQRLRREFDIALFYGVEISTDHGRLLCFF